MAAFGVLLQCTILTTATCTAHRCCCCFVVVFFSFFFSSFFLFVFSALQTISCLGNFPSCLLQFDNCSCKIPNFPERPSAILRRGQGFSSTVLGGILICSSCKCVCLKTGAQFVWRMHISPLPLGLDEGTKPVSQCGGGNVRQRFLAVPARCQGVARIYDFSPNSQRFCVEYYIFGSKTFSCGA